MLAPSHHHTSPIGWSGRGDIMSTSIPEMDTDNTQYFARLHELPAPSPCPSHHSSTGGGGGGGAIASSPTHGLIDPKRAPHYDSLGRSRAATGQRMRIPSNQSVASKSSAGKMSGSSTDRISSYSADTRGSPMLMYPPPPEYCPPPPAEHRPVKRPSPGDVRNIYIEKSSDPLGIQILEARGSGGIFVKTVNANSLAAMAGLQVGDQLLEVCGINMRSANYQLAKMVLLQCGDSISMKVQYNPDKYNEQGEQPCSQSNDGDLPPNIEGADTLRREPPLPLASSIYPLSNIRPLTLSSSAPPLPPPGSELPPSEPRIVFLKKVASSLGVTLIGGNAVGIFVHAVKQDSVAHAPGGLRCGDQILESTTRVRQEHVQEQAGDSFYVRAMFDHARETDDELSFKAGDILYVDNTMFHGIPARARAWIVDRTPREAATYSSVSLNSEYSASTTVDDIIPTYQKIERVDCHVLRPIVLVGPLVEKLAEKLVQEFPHQFSRSVPEIKKASEQAMERGVADNNYIDFRRRGTHFECITVSSVKQACSKCTLDCHPRRATPVDDKGRSLSCGHITVRRNARPRGEPTPRRPHPCTERPPRAVIPGGPFNHMCRSLKQVVDHEQGRSFWVPSQGL
ncbi:PREDICTED: disks large homolog 5-like [Priapulus caudatus]|uniref:Disks large homolog 5-like n=1 Tax=Priapulus caudatus TaxID=37621 RepID=A0ABM1EYM0_PRICU|nr:PREDICTED: disks large homolog 5-like [Priapulus caudatus]